MHKSPQIKVAFVLPSLVAGGAERVMSFLAKSFNPEKFNVTLIVFGYKKEADFDIQGINTVFFEKSRVLNGTLTIVNYLRTHPQDIVISAIGHLNTLMAYVSIFFPKTKFIAREVNVLSVLKTFDEPKFSPFTRLSRNRFKFFDAVVCQSIDMLVDLKANYKINEKRLHVINNPITDNFRFQEKKMVNEKLHFITVARLAKEKGHDRIILALSKLTFPFQYTVIGDGPEKENIFQLAEKLNLSSSIEYIPYTKKVDQYLAAHDVYLQGSYTEGFPNALIESCAIGTPVIAFDAPGGLNEIIVAGKNGFIAKNEADFLKYINLFQQSNNFNPKEVSKTVTSKFGKKQIVKQYEDLFIKLASK